MDDDIITSIDSIRSIGKKYPLQSAALIQAYSDLSAAQQWVDLRIQDCYMDFNQTKFVLLRGKPNSKDNERIIYPISLNQITNFKTLKDLFKHIQNPTEKILLAIVSTDSSIVYYELASGIVSPKEVPE
ncbi:Sen15 protein-domain-containing protein [Melampsora americana]|nr:Sen15 protein-domain-containing protein [Melampsora americana]